jgi:hypothetical protein
MIKLKQMIEIKPLEEIEREYEKFIKEHMADDNEAVKLAVFVGKLKAYYFIAKTKIKAFNETNGRKENI